jgi:hypothetical protein
MALDVCPSCGLKQFNPSTRKCYVCRVEVRKDGTLFRVPDGYYADQNGNVCSQKKCEIRNGKLYVSYHYLLEDGKDTLRGEYPKIAEPPRCVHPERRSCNYGDSFERCDSMKHESGS